MPDENGYLVWVIFATLVFWGAFSLGYYFGGKNKAKKLMTKRPTYPSSPSSPSSPLFPPPSV